MREYRGIDLDRLALATRIRRQYLQAVEEMRLDQLPSRPFAIGYVRAYASALDLDPDQAVLRFRRDAPEKDEPLRAPVGVTRERDPRLVLVGVSCAIVIGGVLLWNIAQRAMMAEAPPPPTVADAGALPPPPVNNGTPVAIGAPTPPPQEATTPKPYVTPGLEQQLSASNDTAASAAGEVTDAQAAAAGLETAAPAGTPFMAKGEVFGAPPSEAAVILQARKASALTIQGADGTVYFARLLAPGQAYRAPLIKGLTVVAPQPDDFDLYVGGLLKGPLTAGKAQATTLAE
ncbi:helix-turn-helix domain-containing protein [Phenylobacterium montanum]|uniref:Helix-turn-helix domain-containing protein n=1 Tax=Phenylobacterium montanum TaxID=2823693 RepID=A0A975FYY1_9CAUL|nr:helix-turn-helix domain-containing protein [Caulobacter sp. S6]QUD87428.1 helix-turn-helix domain-containing protein [Caulobacter sp. S6]